MKQVRIEDSFWAPRQEVNWRVTLPYVFAQIKNAGRIDAFRPGWKPGPDYQPRPGRDSDPGKWIEAAAYAYADHPTGALKILVNGVIAILEKAQRKDGYLNSYHTLIQPGQRWTNLFRNSELYCAGHLIEAAVAWHAATGERRLLEIMCRYADHIDSVFGPQRGKKRGYPGHPEMELALVKLHRTTGERRYLKLAEFFVNERGRAPNYFLVEAERCKKAHAEESPPNCANRQAHLPIREQTTVEGHAVCAMYLFCGVTDVAAETGDASLLRACKRLWKNVTERRMYVTGGVGASASGESFSADYDLPNQTAYAETCAAVGLALWAHRMLHVDRDGRYADVMERALYNGVLSGVSLEGDRFFYSNPLAVFPNASQPARPHLSPTRRPWFRTPCCPTNLARLLGSFGNYIYSQGRRGLWVHLYVQGRAEFELNGTKVVLKQKTRYPWRETVQLSVEPEVPATFTLALRIPGWCRGAKLKVNERPVKVGSVLKKGYAKIKREWKKGDKVELILPMPVERVRAHPKVRANVGRVALQRGPVVYCLEEVDNGPGLDQIVLPAETPIRAIYKKMLGGMVVLTAKAKRLDGAGWKGELYHPCKANHRSARITAVPYCLWNNREDGEMLVWIREE